LIDWCLMPTLAVIKKWKIMDGIKLHYWPEDKIYNEMCF
jgi:hypothetical protein